MASSAHSHDEHAHDGKVHAHVSSWPFLVAIFLALIFLTVVTVAVSYVDLGVLNTFVAVAIATVKATLVALFFMHLRHDKPFNAYAFLMSFAFLAVFIILTMADLGTRARVDAPSGGRQWSRSGEWAQGGPDRPSGGASGAAHGTGSGGGSAHH